MKTPLSLLDRLRDVSDTVSWSQLVDLYTPFLRRIVAAQQVAQADIDDLLQEVFDVLLSEMPDFRHSGRTGAFRHWLRQIMVNRLRRFWQAKRNSAVSVPLDELEGRQNELHQMWEAEHNRWITQRLIELIEPEFTPTTWIAFHRQVVEDQTAREVADELQTTVNAVLIAKSRVLRRLRQELQGLTD